MSFAQITCVFMHHPVYMFATERQATMMFTALPV